VSEYDDSVGDLLSQSFSFSVADWTIPITRRVTIRAGLGGHAARPDSFGNYGLVSVHCQNNAQTREVRRRQSVVGTVCVDKDELPRPFPKRIRVTVEPVE